MMAKITTTGIAAHGASRLASVEIDSFNIKNMRRCLDLALGIAGPSLGLLASGAGLSAVFLSSAIIVLSAAVVAVWLLVGSTSRARSFR